MQLYLLLDKTKQDLWHLSLTIQHFRQRATALVAAEAGNNMTEYLLNYGRTVSEKTINDTENQYELPDDDLI